MLIVQQINKPNLIWKKKKKIRKFSFTNRQKQILSDKITRWRVIGRGLTRRLPRYRQQIELATQIKRMIYKICNTINRNIQHDSNLRRCFSLSALRCSAIARNPSWIYHLDVILHVRFVSVCIIFLLWRVCRRWRWSPRCASWSYATQLYINFRNEITKRQFCLRIRIIQWPGVVVVVVVVDDETELVAIVVVVIFVAVVDDVDDVPDADLVVAVAVAVLRFELVSTSRSTVDDDDIDNDDDALLLLSRSTSGVNDAPDFEADLDDDFAKFESSVINRAKTTSTEYRNYNIYFAIEFILIIDFFIFFIRVLNNTNRVIQKVCFFFKKKNNTRTATSAFARPFAISSSNALGDKLRPFFCLQRVNQCVVFQGKIFQFFF